MAFLLLKFAYQDFIDEKQFNNVTEKTLKNYEQTLSRFIEHCHNDKVLNVNEVTKGTVKSFLREEQLSGNMPGTINTKIMRINAFFNYLVNEEIIKISPSRGIKRQATDTQIEVFNDEQISQMLRYYRRIKHRDKAYFAYRDYMMILFLLGTGARRGEIVNLQWNHVDLVNNTVSLVGKNRMLETIPITQRLVDELLNYKEFCSQYFGQVGSHVFVGIKNKPMSTNAITQIFKNLGQVMDFKGVRVSCHTFRHTFCHRLCVSGASTFAIQKLMRHRTLAVTAKYVAMWGEELRGENDKHNPLNRLEF